MWSADTVVAMCDVHAVPTIHIPCYSPISHHFIREILYCLIFHISCTDRLGQYVTVPTRCVMVWQRLFDQNIPHSMFTHFFYFIFFLGLFGCCCDSSTSPLRIVMRLACAKTNWNTHIYELHMLNDTYLVGPYEHLYNILTLPGSRQQHILTQYEIGFTNENKPTKVFKHYNFLYLTFRTCWHWQIKRFIYVRVQYECLVVVTRSNNWCEQWRWREENSRQLPK